MSVYYKFYRNFFGYSQIRIKGEKEKLLNTLMKKEIEFWGSEISEENSVLLCGSVLSAGKIIKEAENLCCEVEIIKRKGLPFVFNKYKRRYGIFVGVFLAWFIIFFSSLLIWEVRVGTENVYEQAEIVSLLEKQGFGLGSFLPRVDVRRLENEFLMNNPQYSSFAINICGTVASIEFRRAVTTEETTEHNTLCNVIATKGGTIVSVEAYGGAPVVKVGDTVSEGDLLISAYMQGRLGVWRGVHAYGKVTAAVYYDFKTEIPVKSTTSAHTGKSKTKTSIRFFSLKANLFQKESSPFERCTVESEKKQLSVFGIKLPIIIEKSTYSEQKNNPLELTKEEAESRGKKEFELWKEREVSGKIISENVSCVFDDEKQAYSLTATITVLEDIGKEQVIE